MQEMQEMQVWSLSWEDALKKEMATHSKNFAWEIPWTEEPGGLQSMGWKKSDMTEQLRTHTHLYTYYKVVSVNSNAIILWTNGIV